MIADITKLAELLGNPARVRRPVNTVSRVQLSRVNIDRDLYIIGYFLSPTELLIHPATLLPTQLPFLHQTF